MILKRKICLKTIGIISKSSRRDTIIVNCQLSIVNCQFPVPLRSWYSEGAMPATFLKVELK